MSWTYNVTTTDDWYYIVTEGNPVEGEIVTKDGRFLVTKDGRHIKIK